MDGAVNALPTRCFDRARNAAGALMRKPPAERGALAGLPVPIKDLADVTGCVSTQGSPIFRTISPRIPTFWSSISESNGAIVYAKSNTPELAPAPIPSMKSLAARSTLEYVALGGGLVRRRRRGLGDRPGLGGARFRSWRLPAQPGKFCGVVGLRPSPGRIAASPRNKIDGTLGVEGPMARNVEDGSTSLRSMVGEEPGDPISLPRDGTSYWKRRAPAGHRKRVASAAISA